ncbi:MAG: 50S ribosomal protein L11 methyltransferase [Candidatus Thorarchaeota archaeon]|nr:50S ribosomal protein L11 methyltransferase [Candidatus Thorarchaeota archaeon]
MYATPFSLLNGVSLLSQKSRLAKFRDALSRVVRQDSLVIDLGSGSGVLALLAARMGARRVIAVEINESTANYARQAARLNGLEQKVEFAVCHFADFYPDELADVVVCEMLCSMMLVEQQVAASHHAVRHLLRPGGVLLPRRADVYVVPVECEDVWRRFKFDTLVFPPMPQTVGVGEARDLADPQAVAHLDFISSAHQTVDACISFRIAEDGVMHGICGMFEAFLDDLTRLDMTDGWRDLFVPLKDPVEVTAGDSVVIELSYTPGELHTLRLVARR